MSRVLVDDLFGERPRAVRMRVIRSPHYVTFAEEVYQVQSHQIRLISRPNLALEDLARHRFEWNIVGLLAFELPLVAIVHFLDDERNPTNGGFSETELQLGMTLQGSEVKHIYKRVKKGRCAIAEPHIEDPLPLSRLHSVNRGPNGSRLRAAADVIRYDDAGVLSRVPEHVPWLQVHLESDIVDQEVRFAETQLRHSDNFISGGLRID